MRDISPTQSPSRSRPSASEADSKDQPSSHTGIARKSFGSVSSDQVHSAPHLGDGLSAQAAAVGHPMSALGQKHSCASASYPLYPQKRTLIERVVMSALCHSCSATSMQISI